MHRNYKKNYEGKYFSLVLIKNEKIKDISFNYILKQSAEQKRNFMRFYFNFLREIDDPDMKENDPSKFRAKMAQRMGAITKKTKADLSLMLCQIFFDTYGYRKSYYAAQKFVYKLSEKNLKRENALGFFANPETKPGTISDFLDRNNTVKVKEDMKEFNNLFNYKSISQALKRHVVSVKKEAIKFYLK